MSQEASGVSVSIMCAFVLEAEKVHGPKYCGDGIEKVRELLARAEAEYARLPDVKDTKSD